MWFHFECIFMKPSIGQKMETYRCLGCCKRYHFDEAVHEDFIWETHERLT